MVTSAKFLILNIGNALLISITLDGMKTKEDFQIQSFPYTRQFTMDVGKLGMLKHHIKALIEIDVTESREKIKSKQNESPHQISFTSWAIKCISQAVSEHKQVQAPRKGKNKLLIFDDIDISLLVEKELQGQLVPIPLILRKVNKKSIGEIYWEIEKAKRENVSLTKDYVIEKKRKNWPARLLANLPQWVRLWVWKILLSNPQWIKKMMGTVIITSIGMVGNINGWAIPFSIHPVCFAIGSINQKPAVHHNQIVPREFLQMTILLDHDVIDGAPAVRFVSRMTELMEKGYGLE